jgi:hypothetical protein
VPILTTAGPKFLSVVHWLVEVSAWPFRKYTHAFALMRAKPPFPIEYVGQDFRFAAAFRYRRDLVQFCTGMALKDGGAEGVLIAYGVADCEARLARYGLEEILRPMSLSLKSPAAAAEPRGIVGGPPGW